MEDSTNEKVKHEKQRRNIMYMLFGQYVYISIRVINVLSYLSIFFYYNLLFQPSCLEVISGNAYMTVCFIDTCPLRKLYHLN